MTRDTDTMPDEIFAFCAHKLSDLQSGGWSTSEVSGWESYTKTAALPATDDKNTEELIEWVESVDNILPYDLPSRIRELIAAIREARE